MEIHPIFTLEPPATGPDDPAHDDPAQLWAWGMVAGYPERLALIASGPRHEVAEVYEFLVRAQNGVSHAEG